MPTLVEKVQAAEPSEPTASRDVPLGLIFGALSTVIWGGYLTVTRHGIEAGLESSDLAFIRYTTAGLLLLPLLLRRSPRTLAGVGWGKGAVLAFLAGPPFVLIGAGGFNFAPLAHGAVIQLGVLTLMSICLAALMLREPLHPIRIIGLAILVAGLGTIAGPGLFSGSSDTWIGDIMFAVAGSMFAVFTILIRRWEITSLDATVVVSVLSGVAYAPIYLITEGSDRLVAASPAILAEQILVLGPLSGIIALFAFAEAIQRLGASRAALFPAMFPAVAILIGIPLVGELPTTLQWLGLAITTAGLILALHTATSSKPSSNPV